MRKKTTIAFSCRGWVYCTFDTPVVWHIKSAPTFVVEVWLPGRRIIAHPKTPVCIKINNLPYVRHGTR
jgi:hypothetical protein